MSRRGRPLAVRLARALLCLYPPSVRRDVTEAMLADIRRQAQERAVALGPLRRGVHLASLVFSLLGNAFGAWADVVIFGGRRRPRGIRAFSALDVKLGLRMLVKYPGLAITGGLGIAVAIAIGGGFFAFAYAFFYPTIPLDEGDRLVGLENWDVQVNNEFRRSMYDFGVWRDEMRTVEDLTAFRTVSRNLIREDGTVELIRLAEITPSGFRLARVPPLLGRGLVESDASPDAPNVMVLGYDVWRTRFTGDPKIVGTDVRIGPTPHTIVGVMPPGFAFPMNHDFWVPLRGDPASYPRNEGPAVFISGRLVPGATLRDAQNELALIGRRMAAEFPDTHARFAAHVLPYTYPLMDVNENGGESMLWEFVQISGLIALLLGIVCINVAVLVYARTATRRGEIAVRSALGAGRVRIVGQLFVEAFVLCALATVAGLAIAKFGIALGHQIMETELDGAMPFWLDLGIPGPAIAFIAGMTLLAATIIGVIPGLQATSGRVQANLNQFHNCAGPGLGRTWTALVVVQVAIAVCALPVAVATGWWTVRRELTRPTYPVGEYMGIGMAVDPEAEDGSGAGAEPLLRGLARVREELMRRLDDEPGVVGLAVSATLPGEGTPYVIAPESDEASGKADAVYRVRGGVVGTGLLELFGSDVLQGRSLRVSDTDSTAADVVVVNRRFARRVFGEDDVVGRRIRFIEKGAEDGVDRGEARWYEIVGVVGDLTENLIDEAYADAMVYRPMDRARTTNPIVVLRVGGRDHQALAARIRSITASLDPTLRVRPMEFEALYRQQRLGVELMAVVLAISILSVLLLSAAGIYALVSFTVTQRRREIGIRRALGAEPSALLVSVFAHAAWRLGLGVLLGVAVAALWDWTSGGELLHGLGGYLLWGMALLMSLVGLFAAGGPARRGLAVEAVEVMRG